MSNTTIWMILYGLSLVLVVNLTNLISHAFSKQNMVTDEITHRSCYMVPDPGFRSFKVRRQGLRSGTFLSFYSLLVILAFVILTVYAFVCSNHWWQVIIAFILGNIISNIYSKSLPLVLHTIRYYLTHILTIVCMVLCFLVLSDL
jgi:hypothetical protein